MNAAAEQIDAYRWLVGPEGAHWLALATERGGERLLETTAWLRRSLSPMQVHLVLETVELRRRATEKFPLGGSMFLTRQGWEQATDAWVASHKAERFHEGERVVDLCSGIGGDLIALARRGRAIGIDRDPGTAIFAEANLRAYGVRAEVVCREASAGDLRGVTAWHVDPDRRAGGRRTTHVDAHSPSAAEIDAWRAIAPDAAVKLSPATTPPAAWEAEAECEWISRAGQCRQMVAWFGRLARDRGRRAATILPTQSDGPPRRIVGAGRALPPVAESVEQFVYEPDAAVLAAQLTAELANEHSLRVVSAQSAYLTSDQRVNDCALAAFEVLAVLPLSPRKIKPWLREHAIGRLEIKKRGLDVDPERLRRELAVPGDRRATLLAARTAAGAVAIMAVRLAGADDGEPGPQATIITA